jgi:hypothetical protein
LEIVKLDSSHQHRTVYLCICWFINTQINPSGINVTGIVTATNFVGNLTGNASYASVAGVATYASVAGVSTYASTAGIATYASVAGVATYASTAGIATYASTAVLQLLLLDYQEVQRFYLEEMLVLILQVLLQIFMFLVLLQVIL